MLQKILKFSLGFGALVALTYAGNVFAAPKTLTLTTPDKDYLVSSQQLNDWDTADTNTAFIALDPEKNYKNYILQSIGLQKNTASHIAFYNHSPAKIYAYLKTIAPEINRDPVNSVFKMEDGKITDFNPGENGQDLDLKTSVNLISAALDRDEEKASLSINQSEPAQTLAQTNNLGIKELIARGDSSFSGSPANRIFNIKVGVGKQTGTIIKPGEEFSFNKFLGPVDGEHGFKPELVIKKEGTVPEFGGGLCQVSSTMFRAAANAGLPITARRNHSYAVQYYSPQGTDATIYPGVQDLKFINNTSANILIWPTYPEKYKLRFSIYGTRDLRQVAFEGPNVYDKKPDGSMKATWTRHVTMPDGKTSTDVFKSVYQSPALFHKVEEFPKPQPAGTTATPAQTEPQTQPGQTPNAQAG